MEFIKLSFKLAGRYKDRLKVGILLVFLQNASMLFGFFALFLAFGWMNETTGKHILAIFGVLFASFLFYFLTGWAKSGLSDGVFFGIFKDYRLAVGEKLKKAPMGYFAEQSLSRIMAAFTNVMKSLENYSTMSIDFTFSGISISFFLLIGMFGVNTKIGILTVVCLIIIWLFVFLMVNQAKKIAAVISKYYCEKCDALIVPTRKVEDILYSYDVDKTMNIIPTGLYVDKFYRENYTDEDREFIKESYGITNNDFLCVYIGRVAEEKSIDVLIDMFSKINNPNYKFMIVGKSYGSIGDKLKEQAKNLGIEDRVIFVGEIPHDNVAIYYQIGDVFLNASISETQGLTFVEAMVAKVPVNARFDKNLEDLLVKNDAGLVYKNEEEFIENIKKLKEDKEFRDKIINNAFEVSKDYTAEKFGERVEALYKKTIKEYNKDESFTIFRGEKYFQQIRRWASSKSSKRSPWSK